MRPAWTLCVAPIAAPNGHLPSPEAASSFTHRLSFVVIRITFLSTSFCLCSEELKGKRRGALQSAARHHPVAAAPTHPTAHAFVAFGNRFLLSSSHLGGLSGALESF